MNIFNYESKFNQLLMTLADLIILNLLFVVCSLPIFTIGAAQAGLFTGIRVLMDPKDDRSVAKSFFRGFTSGFGKITIITCILTVVLYALLVFFLNSLVFALAGGSKLATILCVVGLSIVFIIHCNCAPFHATFDCTAPQLLRNSFFVAMANPLRSILSAALIMLPIVVALVWPHILLAGMIAFITLYYSTAYLIIYSLYKKPFQRLKDIFYKAQEEKDAQPLEGSDETPSEDAEVEVCEDPDDSTCEEVADDILENAEDATLENTNN